MMFDFLSKKRYYVSIGFKQSTGRVPIDCLMAISEYRRMVNDYRLGKTTGTYGMNLDGHEAEKTFPLQDIDTIDAVPEAAEAVTNDATDN